MMTEKIITYTVMAVGWILIFLIPSVIAGKKTWKDGKKGSAIFVFIIGPISFIGPGLLLFFVVCKFLLLFKINPDYKKVFIPARKEFAFPGYCINCMRPATKTMQLTAERSKSTSDTNILARKTTTTTITTTRKIKGVPYCEDCYILSNDLKQVLRRKNLTFVILLFVGWPIFAGINFAVGSSDEFFEAATIVFFAAFIALLLLARPLLRIKSPQIKKIKVGKGNSLAINLKLAREEEIEVKGNGIYLTFSNADYAKKFREANNLEEIQPQTVNEKNLV